MPEELIAMRVGEVLFQYEQEICARDIEFFRRVSLFDLLQRVDTRDVSIPANIKDDFFAVMSTKTLMRVLDSLNILLKLYARIMTD